MKPITLISALGFLILLVFSSSSSAHEGDRLRGQVQFHLGSALAFGGEPPFYHPVPSHGIFPFHVSPGLRIHIHYGDYPRPHLQRGHHRHPHRAHLNNREPHRSHHWQHHHRGDDRHFDRKDHGHTKKHQRRFGSR